MISASELRQKYLDFFKSKGHTIIPSASLLPENDATVLFTTAGMHPLVPYLMGEKHPSGTRLTNVQKCVRTDDIDEVGDSTHHTFFEMLGNWSLGDYFKKDAINWSFEFLTSPKYLGLDKNRIAVSVFEGDKDSPFDTEAFETWKSLGILEKRIAKLPKKNNWWGLETGGPCGPDTEMFYWVGDLDKIPKSFNDDHPNWVEIWNDVFMQYNKKSDGTLETLKQKNVDTGMGMERILSAINGFDDNYKTELFTNIIAKIEELSGKKYDSLPENKKAIRVITDHLRAATFIIGDDRQITPSNVGQGYIVRRLIRRAIRYGRQLGIEKSLWTSEIGEVVINDYKSTYNELERNKKFILDELVKEEEKFEKTLISGIKELEKIVQKYKNKPIYSGQSNEGEFGSNHTDFMNAISGKEAFNLFQTYGFPFEMIKEELVKYGMFFHELEFEREFAEEMKKHQELSRTASAGTFKGGLADSSEETTKVHTAAHLMLAGLRKVLGDSVTQKGSNITVERLRFDFSYQEKMTEDQIKQIENLVNEAISKKLPVICEEMSLEDAKNAGAMGVFESKYGEKVKVYTIGNEVETFSKEICGGPHVTNTGDLGKFKILKEESSSAGIRRIKAILE